MCCVLQKLGWILFMPHCRMGRRTLMSVRNFSDEKKSFWVSWLQMPVEFEDVVFALKQGEISRPFFTPQGIHIVKAIERKEILPFEKVKDEIMRRQSRRYGMDRGTEALVEKLKRNINIRQIRLSG